MPCALAPDPFHGLPPDDLTPRPLCDVVCGGGCEWTLRGDCKSARAACPPVRQDAKQGGRSFFSRTTSAQQQQVQGQSSPDAGNAARRAKVHRRYALRQKRAALSCDDALLVPPLAPPILYAWKPAQQITNATIRAPRQGVEQAVGIVCARCAFGVEVGGRPWYE